MKHAAAALLVLAIAGCAPPPAREHGMSSTAQKEECEVVFFKAKDRPDPAKLAAAVKVTMAAAIEAAVKKVPGKAIGAGIELENGKALYEVKVFSDGKLYEVEIDAATGVVVEVEQDDDDDDEDDDDGDDD